MPKVKPEAKTRLLQWALFGVLFSLTPLVFRLIWSSTTVGRVDVTGILSQGELLLVSTALSAAAVGDLYPVHPRFRRTAIAISGCCLFVVAVSSAYYAAVSVSDAPYRSVVAIASFIFFLLSMAGGAASIIVGAAGRRR